MEPDTTTTMEPETTTMAMDTTTTEEEQGRISILKCHIALAANSKESGLSFSCRGV